MIMDSEMNLVIDQFQQFEFSDPLTGMNLIYNLFIPQNYNQNISYPLVLFIHDSGAVSSDPRMTLMQGLGGIVWASPAEQMKHESFVLAPQYSQAIVNDESEVTRHVELTVNLIRALKDQFNIDLDRIYTTGQSMGCMASIAMLIEYPDLFAGALLIAGQWQAEKMKLLTNANIWVVVSEGDRKAFPGMNAGMIALEDAGAKVSRGIWNGQASKEEFASRVNAMISEGKSIKYTVLAKGTVVPREEEDNSINNHIYTWRIAYGIEGLRDWLFSQTKNKQKLF